MFSDIPIANKFEKKEKEQGSEVQKVKSKMKLFHFKRKFNLSEEKTKHNSISLLVRLRLIKGPLFVYALLECIKLSKSILSLQLEEGREILIP